MNNNKKILVTDGTIGSTVAQILADQNIELNVLVRNPERKNAFSDKHINVVVADAGKPETLKTAFEGVDVFFFVSPLIENMVDLAKNVIDVAQQAGVEHIVRSSAMGASTDAPIIMGKLHGQIEELVKSSGIDYTFIRPTNFFQNILGMAGIIRSQNTFYGSAGDGKNGFIDVRDVAAVGAVVLTESGHERKTYQVTGGELLSNYDMAEELSRQLGYEIKYQDLPPEELGKSYRDFGMSEFVVKALLELDEIMKKGYLAEISEDVQKVTGETPITFQTFVQENLEMFKNSK